MMINGEKAYECCCQCDRAVWIGDESGNGAWYCDEPSHEIVTESKECNRCGCEKCRCGI